MSLPSSSEVTGLLPSWSARADGALGRIVEIVYPELRDIARRCLGSEHPDHTIQATALVHETYVRLVEIKRMPWQDRAHFFAMGARLMRRILVDYARARDCAKREESVRRTVFNEAVLFSSEPDPMMDPLGRAARSTVQIRFAQGAGCQNALFRRPYRGRDRGGSAYVSAKRAARLESSQVVAGSGDEPGGGTWSRSAGQPLNRFITRR